MANWARLGDRSMSAGVVPWHGTRMDQRSDGEAAAAIDRSAGVRPSATAPKVGMAQPFTPRFKVDLPCVVLVPVHGISTDSHY